MQDLNQLVLAFEADEESILKIKHLAQDWDLDFDELIGEALCVEPRLSIEEVTINILYECCDEAYTRIYDLDPDFTYNGGLEIDNLLSKIDDEIDIIINAAKNKRLWLETMQELCFKEKQREEA